VMMNRSTGWRKSIRKPKKASTGRRRGPARTDLGVHEFVVEKPYCSPARGVILAALSPYAVPVSNFSEGVKMGNVGGKPVPLTQEARFTVPAQQAEWAEYLLERTGQLAITHGRVNARNRGWASKYGGEMPPAWCPKQGEAAIEPGCKEGHAAWQAALQAQSGQKGR
jgi:hypothetical protein